MPTAPFSGQNIDRCITLYVHQKFWCDKDNILNDQEFLTITGNGKYV